MIPDIDKMVALAHHASDAPPSPTQSESLGLRLNVQHQQHGIIFQAEDTTTAQGKFLVYSIWQCSYFFE